MSFLRKPPAPPPARLSPAGRGTTVHHMYTQRHLPREKHGQNPKSHGMAFSMDAERETRGTTSTTAESPRKEPSLALLGV